MFFEAAPASQEPIGHPLRKNPTDTQAEGKLQKGESCEITQQAADDGVCL